MGVPYLTPQEIRARREDLLGHMRKPSWMVRREQRDGAVSRMIIDRFGTSARVVEIGSSNGRVLKSFLDRGLRNVTGVDIDDYLDFPEARPHLRVADLNSERIPANDRSVDAVVALEVFEHLENPWHFARECGRVLRPGGMLILSTAWGHSVWDKWRFLRRGSLVNFHSGNNHITFLTRDVMTKAFRNTFTVNRMFFDHGWIPFLRPRRWNKLLPPNPWWSLKVCYVMERNIVCHCEKRTR